MAERRATAMRWWVDGFKAPAKTIHGIVRRLAEDGRRKKYEALERIYAEAAMSPTTSTLLGAVFGGDVPRSVWQRTPVIRSAIDTQANRLFRARPRPKPVPRDGDWHVEQRARLLDTWLDGNFERLGMHDALARRVGLDALILGIGVLKGFERDGGPILERVHPGDLHVDKREERYDCVRTIYQSYAVDREVLIQAYPDFEAEILEAPEYDDPTNADGEMDEASDLVEVIEAWRLPNGKDDEGYCIGGVHYITVDGVQDKDGAVLNPDDCVWHRESFPFAFFRYRDKPRSFWGLGIAESAGCMQADLNNLDDVLSEAYNLMTPGMLAQVGSVLTKAQNNEVGRVILYEGTPPQPWTPNAVSPDFINRGSDLEQRIYRMEGISLMSSQSLKPAGIESGTALIAHEDIESERHALPGQAYEQLFVDAANLLIEVASDIVEDESIPDKKKLVVLGGRDLLEEIDFADAQLDRDQYVLRVWPVSRLSRSLTGQLEEVERMQKMGAITDPDDLLETLNLPDMERSTSLRLGGRRLVRQMVDKILRGREAIIHPYLPLDYLVKYATEVRCDAELKGAPEEVLEGLNTLIGAAIEEQKKAIAAMQPPAPPALPPAAPPMGAPMPMDPMAGMVPAPPMAPMGPPPMPGVVPMPPEMA